MKRIKAFFKKPDSNEVIFFLLYAILTSGGIFGSFALLAIIFSLYHLLSNPSTLSKVELLRELPGIALSITVFFGIPTIITFVSYLILKKIKTNLSTLFFSWSIIAFSYYVSFSDNLQVNKYHPFLIFLIIGVSLVFAAILTVWRKAYVDQKFVVRYLLPVFLMYSFVLGMIVPMDNQNGAPIESLFVFFDSLLYDHLRISLFGWGFITILTGSLSAIASLIIYLYLIFQKKILFKFEKPKLHLAVQIPSMLTVIVYCVLLFFSFVFFSLLWQVKVLGKMYINADYIPFLSFHPPFTNTALYGDFFMSSRSEVYLTWLIFVFLILVIPVFVIFFFQQNKKHIITLTQISILSFFLLIAYVFSLSSSLPPENPPQLNSTQYEQYVVKLGQNFAIAFVDENKKEKTEFIGESAIDLDSLIGQKVSLEGNYRGGTETVSYSTCSLTSEQCIKGQCHNIFYWIKNNSYNTTCVIDIKNIKKL